MARSSDPDKICPPGFEAFDRESLARLDDAALVQRAATGAELAFEALMDRYTPLVVGYLYGKTQDAQDAEDIAQDVFWAVYRNLRQLRATKYFKAWLMRIVKSKLCDHHRRGRRGPKIVHLEPDPEREGDDPIERAPDRSESPAERAGYRQARGMAMEAMAKLPDKHRTIVYLRLFGEETVPEIAERLGLSESAVRARMLKGLKTMRKILRRRGVIPPKGR